MVVKVSVEGKRLLRTIVLKVTTELLFIVLPFVIVALVLSYRGSVAHLIYIPEWAIAATVLEGQVLVKFISAFFILGKEVDTVESMSWGGFIFTLLLIICFVPTVLILVFVFLEPEITHRLAITQVIAFIIAVLIFFVFASFLEIAASGKPTSKTSKA
jgi:hypothetical protein